MTNSIHKKTVNSVFWSAIDRFAFQGIQFVISLVLARLLLPSDYGMMGMIMVFIAISQTIADCGFSNALIRKLDVTDIDYSTSFYFNIGIGFFLYAILFLISPYIAVFYDTPLLSTLLQVISLQVIFVSLSVVQRAKMISQLDFKLLAKITFWASLISGICSIFMAYKGFGVWALVVQSLLSTFITTILMWYYSKWKPSLIFSIRSFYYLFNFGSRLLGASLISTLYENIYIIVIGKVYSKADLGFYTKARTFSTLPSTTLTGIFQRVTLPILSKFQNDDIQLKFFYRKYLKIVAFIIIPVTGLVVVLIKPFILFFLTDKWAPAIPLIGILSVGYMLNPFTSMNLNLLQVKGRTDLTLKLEIMKKIIGIIILIITIRYGLVIISWGIVIYCLIATAINTYYTKKIINYGIVTQLRDLMPYLFSAFLASLISICLQMFIRENLVILSVIPFGFLIIYFFILYILKADVFLLLLEKIINRKTK